MGTGMCMDNPHTCNFLLFVVSQTIIESWEVRN